MQLLECSDQAFHGADLLTETAYRSDQLLGIECVVDPPMTGEVLLQFLRQSVSRLRRDDGQAYVRQLGGSENEARGCGKQEGCDEGGDDHGQDATR